MPRKHIFICTGPKCCSEEQGMPVWEYLKQRLRSEDCKGVLRTRVGCLRHCKDGPVALVYPEGRWYINVDQKTCEEIIEQDLIKNEVVPEHLLKTDPFQKS
jgi:(2Fe-2S) ferredoxin